MRQKTQIPLANSAAFRHDTDLIARIKKSDPLAMGELYDRYGKLAYTVILRIVLDEAVAQDLLAETFVKVWNQMARWEEDRADDLCLWFLLLVRSHAIEYLRSRNEPLPRALPRLATLMQPSVLQDFPRPRDSEQWQQLRQALANLTDDERQVLEMASFDGLPSNEIATRLAQSLASVKEAIAGGMGKLSGSNES